MSETLEQKLKRLYSKFKKNLNDLINKNPGDIETIPRKIVVSLIEDLPIAIKEKRIHIRNAEIHLTGKLLDEHRKRYEEQPKFSFLETERNQFEKEINPILKEGEAGIISYNLKTYEYDWDLTDYI